MRPQNSSAIPLAELSWVASRESRVRWHDPHEVSNTWRPMLASRTEQATLRAVQRIYQLSMMPHRASVSSR